MNRARLGAGLPARMLPWLSACLLAFLADACTSQPVLLPSRDFDRPTDITFVCMETVSAATASADDAGLADAGAGAPGDGGAASGDLVLSGRPMRVCHPRGTIDVPNPSLHTFAFLPNSSSGELSVIDADNWSLVNLDPANSGFNRLPLGVLPSQISASDDGCRLVTANYGSCDLSVVDPAALLASTVERQTKASTVKAAGSTIVTNVVPRSKNSGRELRLFAGEVSFLPMGTATMTVAGENLCSGDPGHQWQALATFPSCDLIALIDLPSGVIQKAAYARKSGDGVALVPLAEGEDPVCPADCLYPPAGADASSDASSGASSDASSDTDASGSTISEGGISEAGVDAGGTPSTEPGDVPYVDGLGKLRPGPLAIIPESGRAYVGLANAAYVLAFNVDENELLVPAGGGAIALHEGALGTNRLRLSIDPYKDKTAGGEGKAGSFVGDDPTDPTRQFVVDRQYLYVVARDGTLRIVQVAHLPESECETNLDFTTITDDTVRRAACPAVVGAQVRRPGAIGPGIRLPTPPVDVAVADIRPSPPDQSETSVSGAHAWVLTVSGSVYLVNIDPVLRNISFVEDRDSANQESGVLMCVKPPSDCHTEDEPPPNTLRNRNVLGYTLALDPSSGPPRLDIPPSQSLIGPRIESIWTQGSTANATALTDDFIKTYVFFPDQSAATPQTWSVTWEGNLMSSPRFSGQMHIGASGPSLVDLGMDFCRLGAQKDDIVTLQGCTNTNQCGIGKVCVLGSNGTEGAGGLPINGLCLDAESEHVDCDGLLSTVKRYDVSAAQQTALGLVPHKDELVRPALRPCTLTPTVGADGGTDGGTDAGADGGIDAGTDGHVAAADAKPSDAAPNAPAAAQKDDCFNPADPSTTGFQCTRDHRCLFPCKTAGSTEGCRAGRTCVAFDPKAGAPPSMNECDTHDCFCADAPPLVGDYATNTNVCLGELFPYTVGVGRGFLVAGSQTGVPTTGVADPSGACVPFPGLDPRVRIRIPMNAPVCTNVPDNMLDSRCQPLVSDPQLCMPTANLLQQLAQKTEPDPNPCVFNGGPNEADPLGAPVPPSHAQALFRNREIQFVMTNLEQPPSGLFQISFDVHGGFQPQTVAIPSTVEVTMPTRLVLGPFDSNPQTGTGLTPEVPYLFVVDQRRLGRTQGGGPTRGQLLRIHPRGEAITSPVVGAQPWYEDLSHSANLFPIQ
jgi:hypothetical protein